MVRPTLIELNPVELKYYPFMISSIKCPGSCNVLSSKMCVPKETKDIYVRAFTMIANKMNQKQWQSIFHVTLNANSIVQHAIQIINEIINVDVKIIIGAKES